MAGHRGMHGQLAETQLHASGWDPIKCILIKQSLHMVSKKLALPVAKRVFGRLWAAAVFLCCSASSRSAGVP